MSAGSSALQPKFKKTTGIKPPGGFIKKPPE
jgi:hypothetical protein